MTHRTDECFDCGSKLDGQNCSAGGVHDTPTDESVVEELYVEYLEPLMQEADMAVRYAVKDHEAYYERLRTGSRALLDAIRQALTSKDAQHKAEVEKARKEERERILALLPKKDTGFNLCLDRVYKALTNKES